MAEFRVRIVGIGGQGVVTAGIMLAKAAVAEGYNVSQSQSYGAEVSGTPNAADVIMSRDPILFPYLEEADVIVCMHRMGWERFGRVLRPGGILIYDSTLAPEAGRERGDLRAHPIPAVEISEDQLGDRMAANMVMLGALSRVTGIVSLETLVGVVEETVRREKNVAVQALRVGYEYAGRSRSQPDA